MLKTHGEVGEKKEENEEEENEERGRNEERPSVGAEEEEYEEIDILPTRPGDFR